VVFSLSVFLAFHVAVSNLPAWSTKLSSALNSEYAWVIVSSNRWPGAHAYAIDKEFENLYIGWGHKYSVEPFAPRMPPVPEPEFPNAANITEAADPTRDEELAFENAQKAAAAADEAADEQEEDDE
jgi:radial spoke head protein 4/6